jgi:hypothetical protein
MSSNKTFLASITKLNGQNWHSWSKEMETYLTMEEFWELIDPAEAAPTSAANLKRDKKAYAHIWFLVEPNCRDVIIEVKSGREAWAALQAEHEKDTPSTRMNLRQRFYALSHDPATGVMPFVNEVLAVVRQLESIKRKPQNDEITDKLLIGLHSSFAAVRTNLSLRTPEPSIKEITAALKEFEDNETLRPSFSAPIDSVIKEESLLYAQKGGRHGSGGGGSKPKFDDFDWGNLKGRDGVCFRCGRSGHVAGKCITDMPTDAKERVLNHHAHIATEDVFSLAVAQLPADDPLILALAEGHQAHTAIEDAPRIFSVSEDVPEEFRTIDGYVSDDY